MYFLILLIIFIILFLSKEKFINIILSEDLYITNQGHNTNQNKNRYFG